MAVRFELHKNDKGQFHFSLKTDDGATVLSSEQYESKASAENGMASVKKNSVLPERFEKLTASDGRAYFTLKAANHQVVGTSPMFGTADKRDAMLALAHADAEHAPVVDRT
jgi:uncharacterized protein YegP (UPF0339 family)